MGLSWGGGGGGEPQPQKPQNQQFLMHNRDILAALMFW